MSENGDGFDHLRIPFDKIKFGKKLEVQGYGTVFEGEFDDQKVALKQLNITNLANIKPKLLDEILTISLFRQHPNVVALLGFCDERSSNEIVLVYEYVASGNLADKMRNRLNTIKRLEICLDAARGVEYLHTGVDSVSIVHGNIKPSKILLNSDKNSTGKFEAKVSSFGLSKIVPGQQNNEMKATTKESDVYSFGVMLLEVLCGVSELVDTDDYQERHVSELVPKRLSEGEKKLRKIVHFDIRREIKMESLETYAKIACQCVLENPEARPTMAQVVVELEKALQLQGGEVSYVKIPASKNMVSEPNENTNDEKNTEEDTNGTEEASPHVEVSNSVEGESLPDIQNIGDVQNDPTIAEEFIHDSLSKDDESNFIVENKDDYEQNKTHILMSTSDPNTTEELIDDSKSSEISNIAQKREDDDQTGQLATFTESTNGNDLPGETVEEDAQGGKGNKETISKEISEEESEVKIESIVVEERSFDVPVPNPNSLDGESVPDQIHTDDSQKESSNNALTDFSDPETTKEVIDELNSDDTKEANNDNQSTNFVTSSESSNGDTTSVSDHATNHEMQNSRFLESDSSNFDNLLNENDDEFGDELENLRIPFEKIKFGKQIDVRGYGSIYEGEFDDQHVALKRLNITNLGNIKPKLFADILMIAKFRKHPNVVALKGFCDEKSNEIILVYEYTSSGNLADKMSKHLTTIQRLEICLDAARGLEYLHTGVDSNPGIIHGNIRLSKILLNSDSTSSRFKAKVSGFGLSKLLPGHVQIVSKSVDPMYEVTGKLMKESDVYSFGVLLLEVLCGVPELVDTDDYHERHVSELVPKRLMEEQNKLRKIVHFDIRDEITSESLETYARIACRCVIKNPEERPTMSEVVVELEKALRLQGGEVSYVQIPGSTNGNDVPKEIIEEDIQEEPEIVEETIDDVAQQGKSFPVQMLGSADTESVPDVTEDDKKENDESTNDDKEDITIGITANEESKIIVEKEDDNESKIITSSDSNNGDDDKSDMQMQIAAEKVDDEDCTKDNGDALKKDMDDSESNEIMDDDITAKEITMEVQNPAILDSGNENAGNHYSVLETERTPELTVDIRGDTGDFSVNDKLISAEKNQELESKRSNSSSSESSNGDDATLSNSLLRKSPPNGTTTVRKASKSFRLLIRSSSDINICPVTRKKHQTARQFVAVPGGATSLTVLFSTEVNSGINWSSVLTGSLDKVQGKLIKENSELLNTLSTRFDYYCCL